MTNPAVTYPRRPPFFANRFCRLMTKVCLANQIGPESCYLLMTVAMTEDAKSYRSGVTYWNEQLFPLVGLSNVKSLSRVRDKAVAAGWLHYEPGGKGRPGVYWVNVPDEFRGTDDKPADENPAEYLPTLLVKNDLASGQQSGRQVGTEAGEKRERSGQHSSLSFPEEKRREEEPPNPPQAGGGSKPSAKAKREKKPPQHPESVAVPLPLDTPAFRATWADWLTDRKTRGKGVTELAAKQQLEDLTPLGPERAAECVKASIRNGWAGLFPGNHRGSASKPTGGTTPDFWERKKAEAAKGGGT